MLDRVIAERDSRAALRGNARTSTNAATLDDVAADDASSDACDALLADAAAAVVRGVLLGRSLRAAVAAR